MPMPDQAHYRECKAMLQRGMTQALPERQPAMIANIPAEVAKIDRDLKKREKRR